MDLMGGGNQREVPRVRHMRSTLNTVDLADDVALYIWPLQSDLTFDFQAIEDVYGNSIDLQFTGALLLHLIQD